MNMHKGNKMHISADCKNFEKTIKDVIKGGGSLISFFVTEERSDAQGNITMYQ